MSFKYMGKERRKPYRGSKVIDKTCRNHGSCDYCMSNRLHFDRKHRFAADKQIEEYFKDQAT